MVNKPKTVTYYPFLKGIPIPHSQRYTTDIHVLAFGWIDQNDLGDGTSIPKGALQQYFMWDYINQEQIINDLLELGWIVQGVDDKDEEDRYWVRLNLLKKLGE